MKKTTSTIIFLTAFLLLLGAATAESLFNDPVRFTFTENGKKYEVTLENDKIVSLYINDEAVPEEDFYLYEDMIMEKHQEVKEGLKKLDGELENLDDRFIGSGAIYPNVGDICDYVKSLSLKYIYSKLDILSIPKCDAGYFKFKKSIHSFIEKVISHD